VDHGHNVDPTLAQPMRWEDRLTADSPTARFVVHDSRGEQVEINAIGVALDEDANLRGPRESEAGKRLGCLTAVVAAHE
jgi:hypothetical protein